MSSIFEIVKAAFTVYQILIIIRIFLSWIRHNPYQPVFKFIYEITEPYLRIFRKVVPSLGMIDISPIVALFALHFIEWFTFKLLLLFI